MIVTRAVFWAIRVAQFVCAAVVLGLTAYFMHRRRKNGEGPYARLIYSIIWSCLSIIASIVGSIPTTSTITSYVSDFVFTAGWAAVFGLLVSWFNNAGCGSAWNWSGFSLHRDNTCGQWKAAQAFSFLSMVFWFATFLLGLLTVHRLSKRASHRGSRV